MLQYIGTVVTIQYTVPKNKENCGEYVSLNLTVS